MKTIFAGLILMVRLSAIAKDTDKIGSVDARSTLAQSVAEAVAQDPDTIGVIKALENSQRLECLAPGDEETAVNKRSKDFTADFNCKARDDGLAVIKSISISGKYQLKSGNVLIKFISAKIND